MSFLRLPRPIVIGAGPGGYPCGIRLAQLGVKTLDHREGERGVASA